MKNITWQKITVGRGKPSYKASYGEFTAEINDHGSCFSITINGTRNAYLREAHYSSSAMACKNYFRRFVKSWGAL